MKQQNNALKLAIEILENDDLVAIPTETVYGLAAKIDSEKAIKKVFAIKERPFFDPLIIHVSGSDMAKKYVTGWKDIHRDLAAHFWPGPLSLILPKKKDLVSDLITSGLDKVAVRSPNNQLTLNLIEQLQIPLAAPSANKFKKASPTSVEHVKEYFNDEIFILEDGSCEVGIESTVIEVIDQTLHIYRPGMISSKILEDFLKRHYPEYSVQLSASPVAPGQIKEHYRPTLPLYNTYDIAKLAALDFPLSNIAQWKLPEDATLAARMLYAQMRILSQIPHTEALAFILPKSAQDNPLWMGIHNRLEKAGHYL